MKIVRTTLQCIIVLQSRQKVRKTRKTRTTRVQICPRVLLLFMTFSPPRCEDNRTGFISPLAKMLVRDSSINNAFGSLQIQYPKIYLYVLLSCNLHALPGPFVASNSIQEQVSPVYQISAATSNVQCAGGFTALYHIKQYRSILYCTMSNRTKVYCTVLYQN